MRFPGKGLSPWDLEESDRTEQLTLSLSSQGNKIVEIRKFLLIENEEGMLELECYHN